MNERVMMFGAIILAVIAIVLGGYAFGEIRSLSNMVETQQAQIGALEAVQEEAGPGDEALGELEARIEQLSAEVDELNDRVDQISQAFEAATEPDAADEPELDEEEAEE